MQGWNGRQAGGSLPSGSFGPSNHPVKGAGSQLPRVPKRVEGRCSRPMTRYAVTPNPNPGFCPVFATPHHLHSQSQQLGPAVDIGLASLRLDRLIDCLVPALGACFIPAEPKAHNYETGTCLSYVSISCCRSFSFPPRPFSQKSLRIAIFTGNHRFSPAPTGQRPKTFDPNSRTWMIIPQHACPVEPAPESRLRVPFELQSHTAPHSTAQRNVTQHSTITATATAFFATQEQHHHSRHATRCC